MVRRNPVRLCLVLALLLSACGPVEPTTMVPRATTALALTTAEPQMASPTPIPLRVAAATPTSTPHPATSTPRPTETQVEASQPADVPRESAATLPAAESPAPVDESLEGAIAFYSERDGSAEIYVMNADGSDQRRLTQNDADDLCPGWSPDGSHIVFVSDRHDSNPVKCFPDCNYDIYIMNADGSEQQRLTDTPTAEVHPAWSPDGKEIAFVSNRDGNQEIYVMSADGSNTRRLTDNPASDMRPAWSPDGDQLLFSSERDGSWEIYFMQADGSSPRRLTKGDAWELFPGWSPDGTRIAFVSLEPGRRKQDVFVLDAKAALQKSGVASAEQLTDHAMVDEDPTWSPDGKQIAFQSDRDGNFEIYVMSADGSNPRRLTNHRAGDFWPAWRPASTVAEEDLAGVRISIVYDNTAYDPRLQAGWGFAAVLDYDGHTFLFDTGGDGRILLDNLAKMAVDPLAVEAVILSHIHGDHTGGLEALLNTCVRPTVYVPASFPRSFKDALRARTRVVGVRESLEIYPGIHSTGEVRGTVKEQGLVVETPLGIVVITGCAHPGIVRMVRTAAELVDGQIALVIGGFHLGDAAPSRIEGIIADLRELGVQQVAPTHCTGETAIEMFAEAYGDDCIQGGVGRVLEVGGRRQ